MSGTTDNAKSEGIKLEETWKALLAEEFQKPYMKELKAFLVEEYGKKKHIYPRKSEIFAALNLTPFPDVKAVILGQDPYHGPGQAHGLCFSVRSGIPAPPSLQNIFQELKNQCGFKVPASGDLTSWAKEGVLLLNSVLTVEQGKPGSHQNKGWEIFTDKIIELISQKKTGVTFILWGSFAQKKAHLIDPRKHQILRSAHPSPLSSYRGFFGNNHFLKTNEYLKKHGQAPINWNLG